MIRLVKRSTLETEKYDSCIAHSQNPRIYAFSWYLDVLTEDWDVLVLGDYQSVMPLPYLRLKRFLYQRKILQPTFCQQLGVFHQSGSTLESVKAFYEEFAKLKPKAYNFNSSNTPALQFTIENLNEKVNYELHLKKSYEDLRKSFAKNLKNTVSKASRVGLNVRLIDDIEDFVQFKKKVALNKIKDSQYDIMAKLIHEIRIREMGMIHGIYQEEQLIGAAFFVHTKDRLLHLISGVNDDGKKHGAMPFLFDFLINKNADQDKIFDFEGSMIQGIAFFYQRFGSVQNNYLSI
ncbi:MAG: hypothetical protein ACI8XB_002214 [Patiriisocius sp.]|jgi:hypothetical protein